MLTALLPTESISLNRSNGSQGSSPVSILGFQLFLNTPAPVVLANCNDYVVVLSVSTEFIFCLQTMRFFALQTDADMGLTGFYSLITGLSRFLAINIC
ncbi:hypothetical protein FGO68_gene17116 [Halteria grandinella]|uniref:Uncharacterized protein n=1 Tax=Halteria grandinella TaxID=5974 RepID=A0A8J8STR2_HALGN|nr:hypothetical protein FGO68_gene17116 [Halteria grandinella]